MDTTPELEASISAILSWEDQNEITRYVYQGRTYLLGRPKEGHPYYGKYGKTIHDGDASIFFYGFFWAQNNDFEMGTWRFLYEEFPIWMRPQYLTPEDQFSDEEMDEALEIIGG